MGARSTGLGTIQPSQSDYFQSTRGGGNGDYYVIVLAPNSVQEMADFVDLSFELAFKYRCPAMILSDGVIGQMMEKVVLPDAKPRLSDEEVKKRYPWAETQQCEDADYIIVSFGSAARIGEKAMELAREEGLKVGLFRPITLWPFPTKQIEELAKNKKGILVSEFNAGQMVEDVRLAVNGAIPVEHFGRLGGIVPSPEEIVDALKTKLVK